MLSQPLSSILVLCLLTLSYCSAMQRNPSIGGSSSPRRGTGTIAAATCGSRMYDGFKLHQAASEAKELLDEVDRNMLLSEIEYTPRLQETMPFSPPYYFHLINKNAQSYAADFVVVTRDGRLAKVVTEVGPPARFIDCVLRYA